MKAEITSEPGDITVAEGQNVTLTCENNGKPEPTLTWRRNNQILDGDRYENTQESLIIKVSLYYIEEKNI